MTKADKLAQVLAEHHLGNTSRERYCICGVFLGDWAGLQEVSAHQAAVVLAHLTAEGWAQGREEVTLPRLPRKIVRYRMTVTDRAADA